MASSFGHTTALDAGSVPGPYLVTIVTRLWSKLLRLSMGFYWVANVVSATATVEGEMCVYFFS